MRGYVRKRGKGSWGITLSLGYDAQTGKRVQRSYSVRGTKRDAEKRLADLLHQADTGQDTTPSKVTVGVYLMDWITTYRPHLTAKAYDRYAGVIRVHLVPRLGRLLLARLRPEHVQKLYAAKLEAGMHPRTVRYLHTVLHRALAWAVKAGMLARNVSDGLDLPPSRGTIMQVWSVEEVNRFLEVAQQTPYGVLFLLALYSGARRGELLALRWNDVDLILGQMSVSRSLQHVNGEYIVSVPKTERSRRTIALPPTAILALRRHREETEHQRVQFGIPASGDDLIFSLYDGSPLRPNTVSRAWAVIAKRAGVRPIRFHDGRHTHATLMLQQGVHPKIVSERLGHSSIAVTLDVYAHVTPGLQEAAAQRFEDALQYRTDGVPASMVGKRWTKVATEV